MMVTKVLSLITLVALRVLVTLSSDVVPSVELVMTRVTLSSLKSTPSKNQEMVGAGTPVAVHISAPEAPSEKVTVGFWEAKMAATAPTVSTKGQKRNIRSSRYSNVNSPNTCSSVIVLVIPSSFTAEQV